MVVWRFQSAEARSEYVYALLLLWFPRVHPEALMDNPPTPEGGVYTCVSDGCDTVLPDDWRFLMCKPHLDELGGSQAMLMRRRRRMDSDASTADTCSVGGCNTAVFVADWPYSVCRLHMEEVDEESAAMSAGSAAYDRVWAAERSAFEASGQAEPGAWDLFFPEELAYGLHPDDGDWADLAAASEAPALYMAQVDASAKASAAFDEAKAKALAFFARPDVDA